MGLGSDLIFLGLKNDFWPKCRKLPSPYVEVGVVYTVPPPQAGTVYTTVGYCDQMLLII